MRRLAIRIRDHLPDEIEQRRPAYIIVTIYQGRLGRNHPERYIRADGLVRRFFGHLQYRAIRVSSFPGRLELPLRPVRESEVTEAAALQLELCRI
jgi:hypothetical protein